MCVAGKRKPSERSEAHHPFIISSSLCSSDDKSNKKSTLLNNRSDFHEVTNNDVIYHHNSRNSFNQKVLPNQLLMKLAKDSIEHKNNKNIVAAIHETDVNDKSSTTNNANKNHHQNFEKNFKEIIKLKNIFKAKRFIITNSSAENLNNFRNIKLQIEKSQDGVDEADECLTHYKLIESNGNENATHDDSSNDFESVPFSTNANGCSKSHRRKSFLKALSAHHESPNDVSAIKIKHVSQQTRGLTDGCVNSNSHDAIENCFRNCVDAHEKSSVINTTNTYSIPNIMINGNVTDLSDQTAMEAIEHSENSVGK